MQSKVIKPCGSNPGILLNLGPTVRVNTPEWQSSRQDQLWAHISSHEPETERKNWEWSETWNLEAHHDGHTSFSKATPPKPLEATPLSGNQVFKCQSLWGTVSLISLQINMGVHTLIYMYHIYNRETERKEENISKPYWVLLPLTVSLSSCH